MMWRVGLAISHFCTILLCGQPFAGSVLEEHSTKPVRGARVQVRVAGAPRMTADLESGADGVFRANGDLPAGEYRVSISKPNYADATLRVRVPLTGPVVVRLGRFGSITGHVTDKHNQPMRGVNVFPMAGEANGQFRPLPMSAQTDDTGQYRLYNLAPGLYTVAVSWATMNPGATFGGAYLFPNNQRPEVFSIV